MWIFVRKRMPHCTIFSTHERWNVTSRIDGTQKEFTTQPRIISGMTLPKCSATYTRLLSHSSSVITTNVS